MTKAELIEKMAEDAKITKAEAQRALDSFIGTVVDEVAAGKDGAIQIAGLGSFKAVKREARTGRNPQTGKEIKIAAKTAVKFQAAKAFKEAAAKRK